MEHQSEHGAGAGPTRRSMLGVLAGAVTGFVAAALAVPGVAYLADPLLRRTAGGKPWRRVCRATQVKDAPVVVPVIGPLDDAWTHADAQRLGSVWLQRTPGGVRALSAECPHLGCTIRFDASRDRFQCPCHSSDFDRQGRVLTGPSPRAMDGLEARERDGFVEVRFARFRTRKPTREEIG